MGAIRNQKILILALITLIVLTTTACAIKPVFQSYAQLIHAWLDQNFPKLVEGFGPLHWALEFNDATSDTPEEPAPPGVQGVGELMTEAFTISVYEGNAGSFSTPPKVVFANYEEYPSPTGTTVYYNATYAYPYYNWLTFPDNGNWIEMQTMDPVTAIGVQLWGDYGDGWVRVSVDGTNIWQGNTNYENCEFDAEGNRLEGPDTCEGGFFYYVQASGLEKKAHTIRATNIGAEDMTIYFFGTGMVKP